jgi:hypothetical protein
VNSRRDLGLCLLATVFAGCGSDAPTSMLALESGNGCPRVTGKFDATFRLESAEGGACKRVKEVSYDALEFGEEGEYLSPDDTLFPCTTSQVQCQLVVRCESVFGKAAFDGTLSTDGNRILGSAVLKGLQSDCDRVSYGMDAVKQGTEIIEAP